MPSFKQTTIPSKLLVGLLLIKNKTIMTTSTTVTENKHLNLVMLIHEWKAERKFNNFT